MKPHPRHPAQPNESQSWKRSVGARQAIEALEAQHARDRSAVEVAADQLTRWASSTTFLVGHVVWFVGWIAWNTGHLFRLTPFDPYPFGFLTMVVSLEAIFLTICVLMAQGREGDVAELREEVTLQVLLQTEAEVTKVLRLVAAQSRNPDALWREDGELRAMLEPLDAHAIERELTEQITRARRPRAHVPGVDGAV